MTKKVIQSIILILLLVGFPLVSWLFLRDGLQYRVDARLNLNSKAKIPAGSALCEKGKIKILSNASSPDIETRLGPVVSHFKDREEILSFTNFNTFTEVTDSLQKVVELKGEKQDYRLYAYLVDTSCAFVQAYLVSDDEHMAALAQDIAFLLPLEKDKDFLIKREREK